MTRLPALFTGAFLLCSAASSSADSFLRLPPATEIAELAEIAGSGVHPAQVIDYGTFRWAVISDDEAARLAAAGRSDLLVADAGQVRVPGFAFDPLRDGEPAGEPATAADSGSSLQLVQLLGPPKSEWHAALEQAGVRVLQYYPCLLYTSPSPRDRTRSRMPSSA